MPTCSVVDVSHHNWDNNPALDFHLAKASGLIGVIGKASEGGTWRDPTYVKSRELALNAGLLWGAYHFATAADPKAQVKNLLNASNPDNETLICVDFEPNGSTNTASKVIVLEILDRIEQRLGRRPTLYVGPYMYQLFHKNPDLDLANYRVWWARYADTVDLHPTWQKYWLWQYTDGHNGPRPRQIDGIGYCDCNHFDGATEALIASWVDEPSASPLTLPPTGNDLTNDALIAAGSATGQWATLPVNGCLVQNNFQQLLPGSTRQSVFVNADQSFGWGWNWPTRPDLAVVAYPEIICGKKPWDNSSTTEQLPARVKDLLAIAVDYSSQTNANGIYNLAFDLWLCNSPEANEESIHTEVMVWIDKNGLPPAGNIIDSFDTPWGPIDLYHDAMPKWTYLACVFRNALASATLDLNVFLTQLVAMGHVDANLFLASVELGNEVSRGAGRTHFSKYQVDIATAL